MLGGGGGVPPPPANYWAGLKSVTTSPTLTGERMLFIPKVSILSEQTASFTQNIKEKKENVAYFISNILSSSAHTLNL